ncbi:MAG: MFS transporter [Candidatus Bipolaricaulota bacterium]|nr:MFS transporter [Candidatus Bipolaricaulota bacterium]
MTRPSNITPWKRTAILFFGHMLNDGYASFFAPLLPLLIKRLDLSLAMAGLLGTTRILISSLAQPGLGLLVDRVQRPLLVVIGPLLTICAMSLIGRVGTFEQLILLMLVSGLGTALFHPAAAALVATGGGNNRGLVMAFFSAGGTLGGALAPLLIVTVVGLFGIERTPWLLLPGILLLLWVAISLRRTFPARERETTVGKEAIISRPLLLLWSVIVLRSMAAISFSNFLAVLVVQRGGSTFIGGAAISVFLFSGAIGGFIAGNLSDRLGRKAIILVTLVLATPSLLLFLYGPQSISLVVIAVAGLFIFSSTPVGVVAAQELLPGKTGLVSGLVMGLAWGVGGLVLTPIGWLADRFSLVSVLTGVAFLPLLAGGLTLLYHDRR